MTGILQKISEADATPGTRHPAETENTQSARRKHGNILVAVPQDPSNGLKRGPPSAISQYPAAHIARRRQPYRKKGTPMAKGQKHGNREAKKPKGAVKKPAAGTVAEPFHFPARPPAPRKTGK